MSASSRLLLGAAAALLLAAGSSAQADNIDLSTVPDRDTVQLTIYNSEDLTLVRERRKVSFRQGANPLQFSWAGTLIDPTSVELKFATHADQLDVLDTTFPHDKPQMLYWNVQSEWDGEATIEISYFTSGIRWEADYLAIADRDERQMGFEGFVRVYNHSGEEYENARVRLVVGTINLIEKIAQLAQIPMSQVKDLQQADFAQYRRESAMKSMSGPRAAGALALNEAMDAKQIIKEGLSEYFIYAIEGTETIPNGWSKRLRSFEGKTVPFRVQYRYRQNEYGDQLVRMYLLANDEASKLGTTPLPDGVVRVFRDNGRDGLTFLVAQATKYVPIGDKIELNLGVDPEVVFELLQLRSRRDNLWLQVYETNTFRQVQGGNVELDERSTIAGWDDRVLFDQRIRNYTRRPIEVEIRRSFGGHAVFRSSLDAKNHDYQTVEFSMNVPPAERADLKYELVTHQGRNSKQVGVTIEKAEVDP